MLVDCDKFSCISHRAKILRKIATVYLYAFVCVGVYTYVHALWLCCVDYIIWYTNYSYKHKVHFMILCSNFSIVTIIKMTSDGTRTNSSPIPKTGLQNIFLKTALKEKKQDINFTTKSHFFVSRSIQFRRQFKNLNEHNICYLRFLKNPQCVLKISI